MANIKKKLFKGFSLFSVFHLKRRLLEIAGEIICVEISLLEKGKLSRFELIL